MKPTLPLASTPVRKAFIGSSKDDEVLCKALAAELKKFGISARTWMNWRRGDFVLNLFEAELAACEVFVLILSPDIDGTRLSTGKAASYGNQNVIFELGAALGRHGKKRVIIVNHGEKVAGLSDLDGMLTEHLDAHYRKRDLTDLAKTIAERIKTECEATERLAQGARIRALTLMRCAPATQRQVIERIDGESFRERAAKEWDAVIEQRGVLWGAWDDYLLFHVPGPQQLFGFLKDLRDHLSRHVVQVNSRLLFLNSYFYNDVAPKQKPRGRRRSVEARRQHLVLLSCRPDRVEETFARLQEQRLQKEARTKYGVDFVAGGITLGEEDIFLVTSSKTLRDHCDFVENHLQNHVVDAKLLTKNTTCLPITDLPLPS